MLEVFESYRLWVGWKCRHMCCSPTQFGVESSMQDSWWRCSFFSCACLRSFIARSTFMVIRLNLIACLYITCSSFDLIYFHFKSGLCWPLVVISNPSGTALTIKIHGLQTAAMRDIWRIKFIPSTPRKLVHFPCFTAQGYDEDEPSNPSPLAPCRISHANNLSRTALEYSWQMSTRNSSTSAPSTPRSTKLSNSFVTSRTPIVVGSSITWTMTWFKVSIVSAASLVQGVTASGWSQTQRGYTWNVLIRIPSRLQQWARRCRRGAFVPVLVPDSVEVPDSAFVSSLMSFSTYEFDLTICLTLSMISWGGKDRKQEISSCIGLVIVTKILTCTQGMNSSWGSALRISIRRASKIIPNRWCLALSRSVKNFLYWHMPCIY